jgi:hypothetical protein
MNHASEMGYEYYLGLSKTDSFHTCCPKGILISASFHSQEFGQNYTIFLVTGGIISAHIPSLNMAYIPGLSVLLLGETLKT